MIAVMRNLSILAVGIALLALGLPARAAGKKKEAVEKPLLSFANGLVTFDFEERLRFEARNNNRDFDNSINDPRDDAWVLSRLRLGIAIRPCDWLKIYAQTQDTREWFSTRGNVPGINGVEGGDYFDLRQLYVELGNVQEFPLSLTVGRQTLIYGDYRLVTDGKWGDFGRTFDGVKLRLETGDFWVDAFAVRPVQIRQRIYTTCNRTSK